jgi:hypothetical protein
LQDQLHSDACQKIKNLRKTTTPLRGDVSRIRVKRRLLALVAFDGGVPRSTSGD